MSDINESIVEDAALAWFEALGYAVLHGPDIAPGEPAAERRATATWSSRVGSARPWPGINPHIPADVPSTRPSARSPRTETPSLVENNRRFHQLLDRRRRRRVPPARRLDRRRQGLAGRLRQPRHNDWLAVNQFTVIEDKHNRRPDIVVFVNGLPLAVVELKNPADENATI